jgi:hypothetical protein
MGPRREVYKRELNKVEQQYAQHNLEKDMAADYRASFATDPRERVRRLKAQNRGRLLFLALIAIFVVAAYAIS